MKNYNLKIRELGEAIKILRNRKGLTQKQLASAAGVSSRQVRLLEQGKHSGGIETIWMITDGIDCNIFELLVLAWGKDFYEYFMQWQIAGVKSKGLPNDEHCTTANNSKSLRADGKIRADSQTKCLYGGGNCDIIVILSNNRVNRFVFFKLRCRKWMRNLNCWDAG